MVERDLAIGEAQRRLRELVLLYGQRDRVLTSAEEANILEAAVKDYGLPVNSAQAIIVSAALTAGVEIESDYHDAARNMILALGGSRRSIKQGDFVLVVKYYQGKSKLPIEEVNRRVKRLVEEAGISPAPAGLFASGRWFRSIR